MPGPNAGRTGVPRPARIYDYWLGGYDNSPADREVARAVEAVYPPPKPGHLTVPREMAVQDRAFTARAVRRAAADGVRQFLVAGTWLPVCREVILPGGREVVLRAVHEAAGEGAVTVYATPDPLIASHAEAMTDGLKGVTVLRADPADPAAVLGLARESLDFTGPVAVVLPRTLTFLPAGAAREAAGGYLPALAAGSMLIVTTARVGADLWEKARAACTAGPVWNHDQAAVASFLAGTKLVPPGVVPAAAWHPDRPAGMEPDEAGYTMAAVGMT